MDNSCYRSGAIIRVVELAGRRNRQRNHITMVKIETNTTQDQEQYIEENRKLTDKGREVAIDIHDYLKEPHITEEGEAKDIDYDSLAESHGLEYVGAGAMRAVFTTSDKSILRGGEDSVIKISKDSVITGNLREIANWHLVSKLDPEFAHTRLLPVSDYDKHARWEVMEMADGFPDWGEVRNNKRIFKKSGWIVSDYGASNMGIIDGNLAMIDYGMEFEGVEDHPKLQDTVYDHMPISTTQFRRDDKTMHREIKKLYKRIEDNNLTKEDIANSVK